MLFRSKYATFYVTIVLSEYISKLWRQPYACVHQLLISNIKQDNFLKIQIIFTLYTKKVVFKRATTERKTLTGYVVNDRF